MTFAPREACLANYILSQGKCSSILIFFVGLGQRKSNLKQLFLHSAAVLQRFGPIRS
jgi:hypothetical protein